MADISVYAFCDANCKHRVLTATQTIALIEEVIANGGQVPEELILSTPIREILDQNTGAGLKFFVGTQAEWDAWTGDKTNVFSLITDDPIQQDIFDKIAALDKKVDGVIAGGTPVANATNAIVNVEKSSLDTLETYLAQGYIDQATYNAQVKELYDNATYSGLTQSPSDKVLRTGDYIVPIKKEVFNGGSTGVNVSAITEDGELLKCNENIIINGLYQMIICVDETTRTLKFISEKSYMGTSSMTFYFAGGKYQVSVTWDLTSDNDDELLAYGMLVKNLDGTISNSDYRVMSILKCIE